jgi:1-aminocyclopropane-1-carboxylate deaminase/D-cysteine desulfhydrase-like pyridoxal-dependent ACC family enzyme
VFELDDQIARGEPDGRGWPDVIVVPLGSGGTYAGLLAGVKARRVPTDVVGVRVTDRWMVHRGMIAWMARRAMRHVRPAPDDPRRIRITASDVHVDHAHFGGGYGAPTRDGAEATALFARDGIVLDPTYTAKAAASLIAMARHDPRPRRYLFWHTLSSAPIEPLLCGGPEHLPPDLAALLRRDAPVALPDTRREP